MAQPIDELYFLTDELGRSYRVNNGTVQAVSTPTPLPHTPDGWQEKSIKYSRSTHYLSQFRSFTTPLKYVKEAAYMVRDQLYRFGTERKLYQVIHRLDKSFGGGWLHKFFYKGELDLSQAEDSDTDISVNIMEGDLIKLFKAYETTEFEIDIDVADAVTVKMDGHYLNEKHNFLIPAIDQSATHLFFTSFLNKEGTAFGVTSYTVNGGIPGNIADSKDYFFTVTQDIAGMHLTGHVKFICAGAPTHYQLMLRTNTGRNLIIWESDVTVGQTYTIDFDYVFDAFAGERFFLEGVTPNALFFIAQYEETQFALTFKSRYKTTYVKGLRPAYVAQKLLDKITGGGYAFTSTHLTTEWENLLITSGDAIRGISGAKLKISWSDFYDSYNVPANLCSGIRNQVLFIEKKADAFQPTIQQAMGEVTDLVVSTAKDFQYNVVKVGYPNTDTEDVNGKDEFNVTQTYTSPITRVNKVLELISKVIASMYEIEIARISLDGKTTTDDNNDSKAFFLHVEKTATAGTGDEPLSYYKLLRNTYTSVAGLLNPVSAFNLELHPELCLKRHGNYLRGIFYWQDAGNLVFQSSDKNGNVVVVNNGQTYIGNKIIRIGSLDPALFIPLALKYKSPMPNELITTMDSGPDGTFSLQYDGNALYGFPMEVSIQPANRPSQESTLLCSPQTDLTKLITISR
jgi:hypothetical protein